MLMSPAKKTFRIISSRASSVCVLVALALFSLSALAKNELQPEEQDEGPSMLRFTGTAYSLDGDRLLYIEEHTVSLDEKGQYLRADVRYTTEDGALIAHKVLDYQQDPLKPNMHFRDKRVDAGIRAENMDAGVLLERVKGEEKLLDQLELEEQAISIVDAGFDRLVSRYWAELLTGKEIDFEFLALTRADFVGFVVRKTGETANSVDLEIAPRNWLIALLMDPIRLRYDRETARLMDYKGVTNIPASVDGQVIDDNYEANIRYVYHDEGQDKTQSDRLPLSRLEQ